MFTDLRSLADRDQPYSAVRICYDFDGSKIVFVNAKPIIQVGIALILLGIVAFSYQGGGGDTSSEKTVDARDLQIRIDITQFPAISPFLGGLALVGGIALVVVGVKKSS
jgi:hypothetical protein